MKRPYITVINFVILTVSFVLFFCIKDQNTYIFLLGFIFFFALFLNTLFFFKFTKNFKNIVEVALKGNFSQKNTFFLPFPEKIKREIKGIIEEKNENEEILQSLIEGVISLNGQTITYINSMAETMLQERRANLIGRTLKDLKMPSSFIAEIEDLAFNAIKEEKVIKKPLLIKEKGIFFDVCAIPRNKCRGVFLILQDKASDYKMVQMGKDFVANASHELRTPLTIIKGFAETLEDIDLSPEMEKEIISKVRKTSDRLEKIIHDLLKLAEVDNVPFSFVKCDLKKIIQSCKEMTLQAHCDAEIVFDPPSGDFFVLAEEGLLELSIKNLLENAIKYSYKKPLITIELKKADGMITFSVQDEGFGIEKEDLPFIFERFFTRNKDKKKGTGLGLAIVKNVIEKHRGKISVTSEVNKGSIFEISLPLIT